MTGIEAPPEPKERSPHWSAVRRAWLKDHPKCAACDRGKALGLRTIDVHHITPYHVNSLLELNQGNLITLCRTHHLAIGHLGNWSHWNVSVVESAGWFLRGRNER